VEKPSALSKSWLLVEHPQSALRETLRSHVPSTLKFPKKVKMLKKWQEWDAKSRDQQTNKPTDHEIPNLLMILQLEETRDDHPDQFLEGPGPRARGCIPTPARPVVWK
jgi:hypothetical protein